MVRLKIKKSEVLMLLGGPLITLILGVLSYLIVRNFSFSKWIEILLMSTVQYSLLNFFITAMPITYNFPPYRGGISDGKRIMELLKK